MASVIINFLLVTMDSLQTAKPQNNRTEKITATVLLTKIFNFFFFFFGGGTWCKILEAVPGLTVTDKNLCER